MNTNRPLPRRYICILLALLCLCSVSTAPARDVSFTWTANSEPVDGYRLYYKSGAQGGAPYDGSGALEGNSPVDTGKVTAFTLHGISDTETWYFTLTAVAGSLESDYSVELVLRPAGSGDIGRLPVPDLISVRQLP